MWDRPTPILCTHHPGGRLPAHPSNDVGGCVVRGGVGYAGRAWRDGERRSAAVVQGQDARAAGNPGTIEHPARIRDSEPGPRRGCGPGHILVPGGDGCGGWPGHTAGVRRGPLHRWEPHATRRDRWSRRVRRSTCRRETSSPPQGTGAAFGVVAEVTASRLPHAGLAPEKGRSHRGSVRPGPIAARGVHCRHQTPGLERDLHHALYHRRRDSHGSIAWRPVWGHDDELVRRPRATGFIDRYGRGRPCDGMTDQAVEGGAAAYAMGRMMGSRQGAHPDSLQAAPEDPAMKKGST